MKFPAQSLLVLLQFAKGQIEFGKEVIEAGVEVLSYCWDMFTKSSLYSETVDKRDIEECLVEALNEESQDLKSFNPAIWVTIGLWVLEKVIQRLSK